MIIVLTVWEDRISPVFDAATTLLLVEIEDGGIVRRRFAPLHPAGSVQLARMLKQMDVSVLICGAISEGAATGISVHGIQLIPFISGQTERILEAFARGEPIIPTFSMPGCGKPCRRRMAGSQASKSKEVTEMPGKDRTGPAGRGPGTGQGRGGCGAGAGKGRGTGRGQGRKGRSDQGPRRSGRDQ